MTSNLEQLAVLWWGNWQLISGRDDHEIVGGQVSKQDKKIQNYQNKMNSYLTDDEAANSIITTPQSQWDAYQIATANLNPDLKTRNKKYQSALNDINVLENEKVNLAQAGEMMMNAYRDAINSTQNAADNMMYANSANAAIQAWGAISGTPGLASNPAAAAQTRMSAQNMATLQNAQIQSNADQNIGNIYGQMANIPQVLSGIWAQNANTDLQKEQLDLQRQQLAQQAQQQSSWSSTSSSSSSSSSKSSSNSSNSNSSLNVNQDTWEMFYWDKKLDIWVDANGQVYIKNAKDLWLSSSDVSNIISEINKNRWWSSKNTPVNTDNQITGLKWWDRNYLDKIKDYNNNIKEQAIQKFKDKWIVL